MGGLLLTPYFLLSVNTPHPNRLLKNAHLLRCAASFVTAAYPKVHLIPQALRALHLSIFKQPPKQGVSQHPAKAQVTS
jgi:hypothetical protein